MSSPHLPPAPRSSLGPVAVLVIVLGGLLVMGALAAELADEAWPEPILRSGEPSSVVVSETFHGRVSGSGLVTGSSSPSHQVHTWSAGLDGGRLRVHLDPESPTVSGSIHVVVEAYDDGRWREVRDVRPGSSDLGRVSSGTFRFTVGLDSIGSGSVDYRLSVSLEG